MLWIPVFQDSLFRSRCFSSIVKLWVIVITLGLAIWPSVVDGYPYVHSIGSNLLWAFQYGQQFWSGQWYPRWLEQSFGSMGSPTFVFYPPFSMIGILPFAALGWPVTAQVIGSGGLATAVMALGTSWAGDRIFPHHKWLAILAIPMVVLSPYVLICLHIRGALGEVWAMAWIPWLLGAFQQGSWLGLALGLMGVVLSHVPTALNLVVLWILLGLGSCLLNLKKGWRSVLAVGWRGAMPLILGLGLSSFFLLPAWRDQKLVNIQYLSVFEAQDNFLFAQGHWARKDAFQEQLIPSFIIILTVTILAILLLSETFFKDKSQNKKPQMWVALLVTTSFFSLLMMTDFSELLYEAMPILQRIQFAWRWLALGSMAAMILILFIIEKITQKLILYERWKQSWRAITCLASIIILSFSFVSFNYYSVWQNIIFWPQKAQELDQFLDDRPVFPQEVDMEALPWKTVDFGMLENALGEPGLLDVWEYTPRTFSPGFLALNHDLVEWETGQGSIQDVQWKPGFRSFRILDSTGGWLILRMNAWPGWRIRVNNHLLPSDAIQAGSDGRLQLLIPPGEVEVKIRYQGTPAYRWGWILTSICGAFVVAWTVRRRLP